ncbi:MAG: amidohydrolase [Firmicutes bacterium HGW-Firmicutes-7]|nr:MAG: amidohydrolase [Firmicutes bacterium HGW-Firmicutes-7]
MIADTVLLSECIFTGCKPSIIQGYVAIKDDKILAIGRENYNKFLDFHTKVIDCGNKTVMPGFHDNHVHFDWGILQQHGVNLWKSNSEDEAAKMVAEYAKTTKQEIIYGFDWFHMNWDVKNMPTRKSLDLYVRDRPVVLFRFECHGMWLNSKAIEYFNIKANDDVPNGGEIYVDEDYIPTGYLHESATFSLYDKGLIPKKNEKQYYKELLQVFASYGITALSNIQLADTINYDILKEMEESDELNIRFGFSIPLDYSIEYVKKYKNFTSDNLYFLGFKTFMDGTILGFTADLLKPYTNNKYTTNINPVDYNMIRKLFLEADKNGFRVRFHAIGDRAIRQTLDFCEEAIHRNAKRDSRHSIAHIELLDPNDLHRFNELDVLADIHPHHITLDADQYENLTYPTFVGERERQCFAFKSILDAKAKYAIGSDYPVTMPNPFIGIYRAITRRFDDHQPVNGWIPEEKLNLYDTLLGYTKGSAYHNFMEDKIGTLEVGKYADIVVTEKNLFECDALEIKNMKVEMTIFNGKIVYQHGSSSA